MGGSENNLCCPIKIINNNNNKFTWKMHTYTKCIYIIWPWCLQREILLKYENKNTEEIHLISVSRKKNLILAQEGWGHTPSPLKVNWSVSCLYVGSLCSLTNLSLFCIYCTCIYIHFVWTASVGVMASVLASCAVDRGFEPRSGQNQKLWNWYVLLLR